MTVTYTAQVASCKRFGCFWKLLLRWKGSIYKLLWPNLFVYIMMYSTLSITYRFLLNESQRTTFEKLSLHCQTYGDLIPVSFVLGFYVSIVVKRWWDQYTSIPWPDPLAVLVSAFLPGEDERSRLMRRTILRYACLSLTITLRMMCPSVKKRFPTMDNMVEAGLMLPNEKKIFDKLEIKTVHPKYWLPLVWAASIIARARREEKVKNDFALKSIIDEINKFRSGCGHLLNYDWISVPLVYTQVVTLAVYTYFMASLMGNQYLNPLKGYPTHTIDLIVPIFTLLQFFFYMGWLMVAETLVNPFGEDDDDFEVNWLIDRNLQIAYLIVDEVHEDHPALIKDQYWEEVFPTELPYTEAAKQFYTEPFLGSARDINVPKHQRGIILMPVSIDTEFSMKHMQAANAPLNSLHLKSLLSFKAKSNSVPSVQRKTSSKSVLGIIRKNMYDEDYDHFSKRKPVDISMKQYNRASLASKSQILSINSTCRNNDFQEDIFRMSDFSVADSLERSPNNSVLRKVKINSAAQEENSLAVNIQENNSAMDQNEQSPRINDVSFSENTLREEPTADIPRSDLNPLVYINEAEQETKFTNTYVTSHWKRAGIDQILMNDYYKGKELNFDYYMAKLRAETKDDEIYQRRCEMRRKHREESNKQETIRISRVQNFDECSEIINLDEPILLEQEIDPNENSNNIHLNDNELKETRASPIIEDINTLNETKINTTSTVDNNNNNSAIRFFELSEEDYAARNQLTVIRKAINEDSKQPINSFNIAEIMNNPESKTDQNSPPKQKDDQLEINEKK